MGNWHREIRLTISRYLEKADRALDTVSDIEANEQLGEPAEATCAVSEKQDVSGVSRAVLKDRKALPEVPLLCLELMRKTE